MLAAIPIVAWTRGDGSSEALQERASAAERAGDHAEAIRLWRTVNGGAKATTSSLVAEARAWLAIDHAGRAEQVLERASMLDPSAVPPWLLRLQILRAEDRQADADRVGWNAYASVPPEGRAAVLRELTLATLAEPPDDDARALLSRWATADPADPDALAALQRRRAEHLRGSDPPPDDRIDALEAMLARHPDHAGTREALVLALLERGDPDRGREVLDAWPADARDTTYDRLRARWDIEYDERPNRAVESLRRVLDARPHDWKAVYLMARALHALGREAEARQAAESVARLREALEPGRLARRLGADFARLDEPAVRLDLAELCDGAGLIRLADAWRREAAGQPPGR